MPVTKTPLIIRRQRATFTAGAATPPSGNIVNLGFANTTKVFSGANNGIRFPARSTVVVVWGSDITGSPGSFTIGGQPATEVVNCGNRTRLFQATMPGADQADDISFVTGGSFRYVGVQVAGWFKNLRSTTAAASGSAASFGASDPQSFSSAIAVPDNPSWGIAAVYAVTAPSSLTWTNMTASGGDTFNSQVVTGTVTLGTAHTETPGSWNTAVSGVGTSIQFGAGVVGAVWK